MTDQINSDPAGRLCGCGCGQSLNLHTRPDYKYINGHNRVRAQAKSVTHRQWVWSNAERRLNHVLRSKFGITLEQYNVLAAQQGHCCAICRSPAFGGKATRWCVDHCHATGRIRGLLCLTCNSGLGQLGDNVDSVRAASHYLTPTPDTAGLSEGLLH